MGQGFGDVWQGHGRLDVARETKNSLAQYRANVHIIPDSEWNRDGYFAYSRGGEVFVRETIPEENRGMLAPHEGTHLMKQSGYQPYLDFVDRTPQMIDLGNQETRGLLAEISDRRGIDLFNATDEELSTLYDELNATLYGHIASGKLPQYMRDGLSGVFYDFDSYAASLASIHDAYIKSRNVDLISPTASLVGPSAYGFRSQIKPTGDYISQFSNAVKPYAGTPHDYAALLSALAGERGERETLTAEQRRALDAWNFAFPELYMSEQEFLAR